MFRDDNAELLTTREVAKIFRVDITTVRRWVKNGLLPATRLPHAGKRQEYRIQRSTVERLTHIKVKRWARVHPD